MSDKRPVIAIDGPAGAGKSTVAKALASRLGFSYLDTGAMYRAVAWQAEKSGLHVTDLDAIADLAHGTSISFASGDPQRVIVDGIDVTDQIRTLEIGEMASAISVHPPIRRELVRQQQAIVEAGGVTLEGRDVTTVVAPHAEVRVYLTASLEERARRRHLELEQKKLGASFQEVRQQVENRDHRDINRDDSPLTVAPGVTVIESGGLPVEEVVGRILALVPPFS